MIFRRFVGHVVDASGRRPVGVLLAAFCVLAATWTLALRVLLHPHTDLRELLPRDSPGLRAFERQMARIGGGAALLVVVESPHRQANERFVDELASRLRARARDPSAPEADLVAYVEDGTRSVKAFYEDNKWLYADLADLESADQTLDSQIAVRAGLVADLEDDAGAAPKPALGLDAYRARWDARARLHDDFPSGYFETPDGTSACVRIVSRSGGLGDPRGGALVERVQELVATMRPTSFDPAMNVGFAGDLAGAAAEEASVVEQAATATGLAFVVIVAGVVWFFGSVASLAVIGLPAFLGMGSAYAFAYLRFGYVNTTGMFLGAIILGNGINYPIVLLSRYIDFLAVGKSPAEARREAAENSLRAELVGASVAAIAYGSLCITHFRGFSQFGWIGFVGMLLVWVSMIPCVPALLVVTERILGPWPVTRASSPEAGKGSMVGRLARWAERAPWTVLGGAAVLTAVAAWKVPSFVRDPWEYDFHHLGSRSSKQGGVGSWSVKAEKVFGGKMNVAGARMLADTAAQVPLLKAQILANDAADARGSLIAAVSTVEDFLPGRPAEQEAKLAVLSRIRDRLTPRVVGMLSPTERETALALRPPDALRVLAVGDLPEFVRRRFQENDGRVGTVFYVQYKNDVVFSDGHNLLRMASATDNVRLPDGTVVSTASQATIFAEMIRSMETDGPRATIASLVAVSIVVLLAARNLRGAMMVLGALGVAVVWLVGGAAWFGEKLNYVNFVTLPITFGIGCEYPFNVYDRCRLMGGDMAIALRRVGGAVALCSFTTIVGYGSMLFADFQALESFGRLAVAGEVACLCGALVLLPALSRVLRAGDGRGAADGRDA